MGQETRGRRRRMSGSCSAGAGSRRQLGQTRSRIVGWTGHSTGSERHLDGGVSFRRLARFTWDPYSQGGCSLHLSLWTSIRTASNKDNRDEQAIFSPGAQLSP